MKETMTIFSDVVRSPILENDKHETSLLKKHPADMLKRLIQEKGIINPLPMHKDQQTAKYLN